MQASAFSPAVHRGGSCCAQRRKLLGTLPRCMATCVLAMESNRSSLASMGDARMSLVRLLLLATAPVFLRFGAPHPSASCRASSFSQRLPV